MLNSKCNFNYHDMPQKKTRPAPSRATRSTVSSSNTGNPESTSRTVQRPVRATRNTSRVAFEPQQSHLEISDNEPCDINTSTSAGPSRSSHTSSDALGEGSSQREPRSRTPAARTGGASRNTKRIQEKTKAGASVSPYEKKRWFSNYFCDPPDADQLANRMEGTSHWSFSCYVI